VGIRRSLARRSPRTAVGNAPISPIVPGPSPR